MIEILLLCFISIVTIGLMVLMIGVLVCIARESPLLAGIATILILFIIAIYLLEHRCESAPSKGSTVCSIVIEDTISNN